MNVSFSQNFHQIAKTIKPKKLTKIITIISLIIGLIFCKNQLRLLWETQY